MKQTIRIGVLVATACWIAGCAAPMDMSKLKPEDKMNPAISEAQRQHMANRGPK